MWIGYRQINNHCLYYQMDAYQILHHIGYLLENIVAFSFIMWDNSDRRKWAYI